MEVNRSEDISKLQKQVVQMLMVSTLVQMSSVSRYLPLGSWGIPYEWLTKKEKTSAWFPDGLVCYADTTQDNPERGQRKNILTVGRTPDSIHGCSFALKEKWSETQLFTDSLVVPNALMG